MAPLFYVCAVRFDVIFKVGVVAGWGGIWYNFGMKKFAIIDGKSVFYRGYYAMGNLSLRDGTPTGGVYGFAAIALEILGKLRPDYVAVAWDKAGTNIRRRREIYAEYKANRRKAPDDFYVQVPMLMEFIEALGWPVYEADDYEADDIMGTLSRQANEAGVETLLISSDMDMLQIVDRDTKFYAIKTGFSRVEEFDVGKFEEKYGIEKGQFLDFKALVGDSSDNIPGVPGVGDKTARELLNKYGSFEGIYEHLDEIRPAVAGKLEKGKKMGEMSRELARIQMDAPVKFDPERSAVGRMDGEAVVAELERLEFYSLVRKFNREVEMGAARESGEVASEEEIDGVVVGWDVKKIMHEDEGVARRVLAGEKIWDLGQGAFLLDPLRRVAVEVGVMRAYREQVAEFRGEPRLLGVAERLDFPLIPILYKMERAGVKIDVQKFYTMSEEFGEMYKKFEQEIFEITGEFNVNSPMQLSEVLYGKLGLPTAGIKKKMRFYSTGARELEKLRHLTPVVGLIEKVREVAKLKSTYVDALPRLADGEGRVHTTYTQNVTATGRLSSVNPNLQNIPVRTELGRRIRSGFVAGRGRVFVSADWAQFELRLAAALAGDEALIKDFNEGMDIHTKTASDVFGVAVGEVSKEQRRAAKVINFGVLYGMSPKGLSEATGMDMAAAKEFIERYFEVRAPIRRYLDEVMRKAREDGYVETYFGRRRPTPDVRSANFVVRAAAERAAANMPIQGTEADLMKKAMIGVDKELPVGAEMVLQVHDSLIVECDEAWADEVGKILRRVMEGVAPELGVRLAVDVRRGGDWGEL